MASPWPRTRFTADCPPIVPLVPDNHISSPCPRNGTYFAEHLRQFDPRGMYAVVARQTEDRELVEIKGQIPGLEKNAELVSALLEESATTFRVAVY